MGERGDGLVLNYTSPLQDLLEFRSSLLATVSGQVGLPAYIDGIQRRGKGSGVSRRSQLIWSGGLQNLDCLRWLMVPEGELGLNGG